MSSSSASRSQSVLATLLTALLGSAGIGHFAKPAFFDAIVPIWMPGDPRATTLVSGGVEIAVAALIANPKTRRTGGLAAFLTFLAVYPANLQAALDGGMKGMEPPYDSAAVAWARLPFQLPMLWAAYRVWRPRVASDVRS